MATAIQSDALDPKTFQSWEDAFKHPIPVVRKLEQQLRSDISGNRERLRTLVGTSYRELLETADTIVQMDKQIRTAEEYLSNVSQKCNTRRLERTKSSGTRIIKQNHLRGTQQNANASHLAMLQMCPRVLVTLIKSGSSLQLIAKILVLSRHLHKRASLDPDSVPFVNVVRLRLGKLRLRLLSIVDNRLANATLETGAVIDAMIAYSLVTNSSCADVLRHFLQVRLTAISTSPGKSPGEQGLSNLRLWMKTIQDTQSLFPRLVGNALSKLKHGPLLQDDSVIGVQELDLDVHRPFLDDDIKHFTPYVRHDDLDIPTASNLLSSWSAVALKAFVGVLDTYLEQIDSISSILEVRRECLQLVISSQSRTIGISKSECLDTLRKVFQKRLMRCIDDKAASVKAVIQIVERSLSAGDFSPKPNDSLWSADLAHLELSDGAKQFMTGVHNRIHGTSTLHETIMIVYMDWLKKMDTIRTALSDFKSRRWSIQDFDDDQEEEPEDLEDMRHKLEREDPSELDETLQTSLSTAITLLTHSIETQQRDLEDKLHAVEKAVFILRLLRSMKSGAPDESGAHAMSFPFAANLQKVVVSAMVNKNISEHKAVIFTAVGQVKTPLRPLWDGSPENPVIPSPWPFRLLKSLHEDMTAVGFDIWTTSAVGKLQEVLRNAVTDILGSSLEKGALGNVAQRSGPSDHAVDVELIKPEDGKDAKTQLLFDVSYLSAALSTHLTDARQDDPLDKLCIVMAENINLLGTVSDVIKASAVEYWKRTSLLFGLLA